MSCKSIVLASSLASALALPLLAGPVNFVVNGDFETGATSGVLTPVLSGPPTNYLIYVFGVGGQTNIGGWTVSNGPNNNGSGTPLSVLVTGNPPQTTAGGNFALDFDPFWNITTGALLNGSVTGTLPEISQTINLPAGQYIFSFDYAIETPGGSSRNLNYVLAGANILDGFASTLEPDNLGYTHFSTPFTSQGGNYTLSFFTNDFSPAPNLMLDNVSIVSTTPEPASATLVWSGIGLLGAATILRRRIRWNNVVQHGASQCFADSPGSDIG